MKRKNYPHTTYTYKGLQRILLCLILICFLIKNINAQQFNNWYFTLNNGMTFNTNPPSFLAGSQLGTTPTSPLASAIISDSKGNLLFSSDGVKVWDKNNNQMPNGFGLKGELCQINGVLIIPFINDTSKYYVFTAQGLSNFILNSQSSLQYSYSIVDMQVNGGLGDVISKNNFIRFFSTEKMTAVPHANGTDIWWICRDWTNNFYSYKVTCSGFQNTNPVISSVGNNINNDKNLLNAGDIKSSSDGKYIVVCYGLYFEIYKFDKSTGILNSPIKIPTSVGCYGVEFSTNSELLYISQFENFVFPSPGQHIVQYSLLNYDSTAIINSFLKITDNEQPFGLGNTPGLQLGQIVKFIAVQVLE